MIDRKQPSEKTKYSKNFRKCSKKNRTNEDTKTNIQQKSGFCQLKQNTNPVPIQLQKDVEKIQKADNTGHLKSQQCG